MWGSCSPLLWGLEMPSYRLPWASSLNMVFFLQSLELPVGNRTHSSSGACSQLPQPSRSSFHQGIRALANSCCWWHVKGAEKTCREEPVSQAPTVFSHFICSSSFLLHWAPSSSINHAMFGAFSQVVILSVQIRCFLPNSVFLSPSSVNSS